MILVVLAITHAASGDSSTSVMLPAESLITKSDGLHLRSKDKAPPCSVSHKLSAVASLVCWPLNGMNSALEIDIVDAPARIHDCSPESNKVYLVTY